SAPFPKVVRRSSPSPTMRVESRRKVWRLSLTGMLPEMDGKEPTKEAFPCPEPSSKREWAAVSPHKTVWAGPSSESRSECDREESDWLGITPCTFPIEKRYSIYKNLHPSFSPSFPPSPARPAVNL